MIMRCNNCKNNVVKAINNLNASSGMKSLSNNILGKFLSSNDYNLKYIALNTLKDVARKRRR